MNKIIKNILKITLFVAIGVVLFYLVYKDFDFKLLSDEFKNLNYWWFLLSLIAFILSHLSRTIRWKMLLDTEQHKTRPSNIFFAILNGYFVNLAIPRLGEVTRSGLVSKNENISFSKVLGTMISERLIDIIMIFIFTLTAFFLQTSEIKEFIHANPNFGDKVAKLLSPTVLINVSIIIIGLFILLIFIAKGKFNKIKFFAKISNFLKGFWHGFISLRDVKQPLNFIFHSVFIWVMYFLAFYICFFAFDGLSQLGVLAGLTIFVASSFGMLAPTPSGIGAYHFMVIQAAIIYGISDNNAAVFALIVHGVQTLFIVIGGIASFVVLPLINKK